ncbi:hypothetical protein [Haloferula sp. BvORR071]|uniref:hypothetical protein n=1 Tax=Haloferula sp. BvORR071 TaxID=1396141 RepID=UPI00054CFCF8|nr:hypothetical protein [Haloferula sp. BvORR071]
MNPLLADLTSGLEQEEKDELGRRVELMEAEFNFIQEAKPHEVELATKYGWTARKLSVVFCLNSFYQRIIAPLWASSQSPSVIGSTVPIRYGKSILFDAKRNAAVNKMSLRFVKICEAFQVTRKMLEAQRASDLIWIVTHPPYSEDAKESGR